MSPLRWRPWLFALLLALAATGARAQPDADDIESGFSKPTPAEAAALREILALPLPRDTTAPSQGRWNRGPSGHAANLQAHFARQEMAARTLGDWPRYEAVIREAASHLPNSDYRNKLAGVLLDKGQFDEGIALRRAAAELANPYLRAGILAGLVCNLQDQGRNEEARAQAAAAQAQIQAAGLTATGDAQHNHLIRATGMVANCLARVELRLGRHAQAIAAAELAARQGRKALESVQNLPNPAQRLNTLKDAAGFLQGWVNACLAAGRLHDAERVLAEYLRFANEVRLPADFQARIHSRTASLRLGQREFALAERHHRRADAILAALGRAPLHPWRIGYARETIEALIGQKAWPKALAELERLDAAAAGDRDLQRQVRLPLARGLTYLGSGRAAEAATLFAELAQAEAGLLGPGHFLAAQASGLQGVALWRGGGVQHKAAALPLLKAAVRDYMAPANADYLENIGIRKEMRELVFAAYLEAMATTAGEDPVQAIGAADWVRGGVVQEALADAAIRAAAGSPQLAEVVRREQDARHELAGLRRYLAGEAGSAAAPPPAVATSMRERIAALEAERGRLQAEIRASHPDYDRLVRPVPPSAREIARQLGPEQALVMLLPTADAVYAWAIAADRTASFVRVALPEAELNPLIARLRGQLDLGDGAAGRAYDSASAFRLYQQLLAPLRPAWEGKTQWVVVTGGALSQLPLAVLHTRAGGGADANAPWLIKEAAIAQVPSLSAWLAIKAIARLGAATQAFAGWGDPAFSAQTAGESPRAAQTRAPAPTRAATRVDPAGADNSVGASATIRYADIPALPDTRTELLAIAATLQGDPAADLRLGREATRASVLAASRSGQLLHKRVIAFATHGLMAGDLPNLSQPALAMAATGAEEQDPLAPLLTLEDVLSLKLNADWVVLSACNTAAADGRAEEALSGLARGFFYAGSRSLLVTHWAVESESARMLTTRTFEHYVAHPRAPKAESLRQAMLTVMETPRFAHPAFWAPYALVGDGGR